MSNNQNPQSQATALEERVPLMDGYYVRDGNTATAWLPTRTEAKGFVDDNPRGIDAPMNELSRNANRYGFYLNPEDFEPLWEEYYADRALKDSPEATTEPDETWMETAGWSYSGYSDILQDADHDKRIDLLCELDSHYTLLKSQQEELEAKLAQVKTMRGMCVNAFIHFSRITGESVLTFVNGDDVVIVTPNVSQDMIDYERHPATFIQKP